MADLAQPYCIILPGPKSEFVRTEDQHGKAMRGPRSSKTRLRTRQYAGSTIYTNLAAHLLLTGADPNLLLPEGAAPIHLAAGLDTVSDDIIKLLLRHGADPNLRSSEGETPLHVSAAYGQCEILRLMLLNGADPDITNLDGQTAVDLARQSGCEVCILTLDHFTHNVDSEDDGHAAFSLEPYEPDLQPVFAPAPLSHTSEQLCEHSQRNLTLAPKSHRTSDTHFSGSINDAHRNCKEESDDSLNSSASFHTCPSHHDSSHPSTSVVKIGVAETLTANVSKNASGTCVDPLSNAWGCVMKLPPRVSPSHNPVNKSPSTAPSSEPRGWFAGIFSRTATSPTPQRHDSTLQHHKPTPRHHDPTLQHQEDHSCGGGGGGGGGDEGGGQQSVSAPSQTIYYSPGGTLDRGDAFEPEWSSSKHPGSSTKVLKNGKSKVNRTDAKRKDMFDDSLSSCGSLGFVPTDFDSDDLSLNLDHRIDSSDLSAHLELLSLASCQVGKQRPKRLHPIGSYKVHERLFGGLHEFDCSLTKHRSDVDQHLPMTSSRNCTGTASDLDNLSLSTINDTRCSRINDNPAARLTQAPTSVPQPSPHGHSHRPLNRPEGGELKSLDAPIKGRPTSCSSARHPHTSPARPFRLRSSPAHCPISPLAHRPLPCSPAHHPNVCTDKRTDSPAKRCLFMRSSSQSSQSSVASSVSSIHYLYTDDEDGYSLVETWYPVTEEAISPTAPLTASTSPEVTDDRSVASDQEAAEDLSVGTFGDTADYEYDVKTGTYRHREQNSLVGDADSGVVVDDCSIGLVDEDIKRLSDAGLRASLITQGFTPGPINTTTRSLYRLKLMRLRKNSAPTHPSTTNAYLPELCRILHGKLDTSLLQTLEDEMAQPFRELDPSRKWREGSRKFSFNYLLLDPRVTDCLPARVKIIGEAVAFRDFIDAVFYIGKGKRARPYAHFKEAIQHQNGDLTKVVGAKIKKILDIWADGDGVISLHVFQNVIPVEAYTREAAMIDAMGRQRLTNVKGGEYYGPAATWPVRQRRALGTRLLHKTFRIFLSEGERHIRPVDIQGP